MIEELEQESQEQAPRRTRRVSRAASEESPARSTEEAPVSRAEKTSARSVEKTSTRTAHAAEDTSSAASEARISQASEYEDAQESAADTEGARVSRRRRPGEYRHREETKRSDASGEEASHKRTRAQSQNRSQSSSRTNQQSSHGVRPQRHNRRQRNNKRSHEEIVPQVKREDLEALKVVDLKAKAAELDLDVKGLKKAEIIEKLYDAILKKEGFVEVDGILDIMSDGYGFVRTNGYLPSEHDAYVSAALIRKNRLRRGDMLHGQVRPKREKDKFAAIQRIDTVNGVPLDEVGDRPRFSKLTPIFPDERLTMEHGKGFVTSRVIDLAAPIGKGQRGLIVSPPKAGKTTVLKDIAASIATNYPEVHLMCLLIDERPEEVTDMQRSVRGEVIASTFDMPSENHIAVSELVIERAKRMVEMGRDVVILLDSITRLARAYNLAQPASGRILSGGVDSAALYPPKKFLGAARNIENGGSLTILASALVETGSKMDEVIFEEFKGTGNMELRLDRNLADRRIFPAIDPVTSGTRKEDLLLDPQEAPLIWAVRRLLANMNDTERAMNTLIRSLQQTEDNREFLVRTARKAQSRKAEDAFTF